MVAINTLQVLAAKRYGFIKLGYNILSLCVITMTLNENLDKTTLFIWRKLSYENIRLLSHEKLTKVLSLAADLEEVDNALSAALESKGIPQEIWNEYNFSKGTSRAFFGRVRDFLGYVKLVGLSEEIALEALHEGLAFEEFKKECLSEKYQGLNLESTEYKRI